MIICKLIWFKFSSDTHHTPPKKSCCLYFFKPAVVWNIWNFFSASDFYNKFPKDTHILIAEARSQHLQRFSLFKCIWNADRLSYCMYLPLDTLLLQVLWGDYYKSMICGIWSCSIQDLLCTIILRRDKNIWFAWAHIERVFFFTLTKKAHFIFQK